jgi:hypothetical protein
VGIADSRDTTEELAIILHNQSERWNRKTKKFLMSSVLSVTIMDTIL